MGGIEMGLYRIQKSLKIVWAAGLALDDVVDLAEVNRMGLPRRINDDPMLFPLRPIYNTNPWSLGAFGSFALKPKIDDCSFF
jgi:hypothetical protein